jgi:Rieske Fe-S protein
MLYPLSYGRMAARADGKSSGRSFWPETRTCDVSCRSGPRRSHAESTRAVTVARIPALAAAGGVVYLGKVRSVPVGVVSLGNGAYRAISLACTHQGVQVKRSGELWRCPAHGSQFTADGTFVAGPAGRDLTSVRSSFNGKVLTVG